MRKVSRRQMMAAGTGLAGFTFLPARVLGRGGFVPPSEKLNIGFVGVGGRASFDLRELANLGHNVVAICDVDSRKFGPRPGSPFYRYAFQMVEQFNRARKYEDWRIMFQKEDKNIDAVVVGTPNHTHSVISLAAMKMGKHVYCEKPVAHSVEEARAMGASSIKYKVTTQSGCQGHASDAARNVVEWIKDGAIGDVRDVQIFTGHTPGNGFAAKSTGRKARVEYAEIPRILAEEHPVPEGLLWDLWLGPAAFRGYSAAYVRRPESPGVSGWYSWRNFGDGGIGDMCCHYFDFVFWALDLGHPEKVEANADAAYDWATNKEIYPLSGEVRWDFPARGKKPPVAITWHYGAEGGTIPLPKYWKEEYWPTVLETGEPTEGGVLITGSKGAIVTGNLAPSDPISVATGQYKPVVWSPPESIRLIPDELDKAYKRPPKTLPRPFNHWADWVESAKAGKPAGVPFTFGGLMTEVGLLGNVAFTQKGKTLYYDGKAGKFDNSEEANKLLRRTYRDGFGLTT